MFSDIRNKAKNIFSQIGYTSTKEERWRYTNTKNFNNCVSENVKKYASDLEQFRELWINPVKRRELIDYLPDSGRSRIVLKKLQNLEDYDDFDVLASISFGIDPKTMVERAVAFEYNNTKWLKQFTSNTSNVIRALAFEFRNGGTEVLENKEIFDVPSVMKSGGMNALQESGEPKDIILETKKRMFE